MFKFNNWLTIHLLSLDMSLLLTYCVVSKGEGEHGVFSPFIPLTG